MLNLLSQVDYTYTTTTTTAADEGAAAAIMAMLMAWMVIIIPIVIFMIVCMWKVFEKAGREGWKAIIPFYNGYVLAEIAGKPGWWGLVGLGGIIPVVGFVASIAAFVLNIIISIELAKSFGKEPVFALLLIFLPPVGYAMLAFGKATYKGSKPAAPKAA